MQDTTLKTMQNTEGKACKMRETIGKHSKHKGKPCKQAGGKITLKSSREGKTSEYHLGQMLKHTCRRRNIAMRDYKESVTTEHTRKQTDAGQSDLYVLLCFAGNTKTIYW